jgi:uncharacterized SAM-binding protein YcdF (DUF218 family)
VLTAIVNWAKNVLRLGNVGCIVVVAVIGAVLLFVRPRWGRRWIVAMTLAYWLLSTPLGSGLLVMPLARGFHPIEDPREAASAEAIVVLGGGTLEAHSRGDVLAYLYEATALRTLEAARVFRLLGGRPLVVASGGAPGSHTTTEAQVIVEALVKLGVPRDRIIIEDESKTTHEQAIYVTRLLKSRGITRFVLVTWPTHLWRSVAVFRAQHADVIPSAAPLVSDAGPKWPFFLPNNGSLRLSDEAVWEYSAGVYYWARGWFRPQPSP